MSPLLNYTTKIPYEKTMTQVEALLRMHGATGIYEKVDAQGYVSALAFTLRTADGDLPIRLPVDVDSTYKVLKRQYANREIERRFADKDHARRVAWRIIKDWLEAQIWLVETEMARMEEILLPYMMVDEDRTLYEAMKEKHFLLGKGKDQSQEPK